MASVGEWGHGGILTVVPPASLKSTANPAVTVGAGSCGHAQQGVRQATCPRPRLLACLTGAGGGSLLLRPASLLSRVWGAGLKSKLGVE